MERGREERGREERGGEERGRVERGREERVGRRGVESHPKYKKMFLLLPLIKSWCLQCVYFIVYNTAIHFNIPLI